MIRNLQDQAQEWAQLINEISGDSPEAALKKMGDEITLVQQNIAQRLPFDAICATIERIMSSNPSSTTLENATFCISKLAESLNNAEHFLSRTTIFNLMSDALENINSQNIYENCLNTFYYITKLHPAEIGKQIGIKSMVLSAGRFSLIEQRKLFKTTEKITEHVITNSMGKCLPEIAKYFTHHDPAVVADSVKTFAQIASKVPLESIPVIVVNQIVVSLLVIREIAPVLNLLDVLARLVTNANFVKELLRSPIDLYSTIDNVQNGGREVVLYEKIVDFLYIALKVATKEVVCEDLHIFIAKVVDVIIDVIKEQKTRSAEKALRTLAKIVKVQPSTDITGLYNSLAALAMGSMAPIILKIVYRAADKKSLAKSALPSVLYSAKKKNSEDQNFNIMVDLLMNDLGANGNEMNDIERINSFDEIYDILVTKQVPTLEFVTRGGIEASLKFLKSYRGSIDDRNEEVLVKLINAAHDVLVGVPIHHEEDPLNSERDVNFGKRNFWAEIKYNGRTSQLRLEITLDFASIESWYNQTIKGLRFTVMQNQFAANPTMKKLKLERRIQPAKLAVLNRFCKTPGYTKCSFKVGNDVYSYRDNVFQAICRSCVGSADKLKTTLPCIEIIESDSARHHFSIPNRTPKNISAILDLLKEIHALKKNLKVECPAFSTHITPALSSVALTHGCFSIATSLFFNYPFIFTLRDRIVFFRIVTPDLFSSIHSVNTTFVETTARRSQQEMKYHCTVSKKNIYEEGKSILYAFGPSMGILEVSFAGEEGIGLGPTQEFFTEFSHEACRASRKIWRTSGDREFAFSDSGLYPAPTADGQDLYILGILCAKALATQFLIDLPLSPEFIRTCRGERVPISRIDPTLANSLKDPTGLIGLDYTYPATDIELIPNGAEIEITEENCEEYVKAIEDVTCGMSMFKLCGNFVRGFDTVLPWNSMSIFTPDEFVTLLSGSGNKITEKELIEHVDVGTGYEKNSPQIINLFQTITELNNEELSLFVKFITGTNRLPVGGIASLQPKLTIAMRATPEGKSPDDTLPTVMTCFNYFKLPKYSSKKILAAKLRVAINECQGTFDLT